MSYDEFLKRFLTIFFVLLLWSGMWAARSVLLMGFAAALIAVGMSIPAARLQRHGWRRGWALAVTIIGFLLVLAVLVLWLVPRLLLEFLTLLETIPNALSALIETYGAIRTRYPFLSAALPEPPELGEMAVDPNAAQELFNRFVGAGLAIAPTLLSGAGNVLTIFVNLGLVLFIAIFFVVDPRSYIKASLFLLPREHHGRATEIWNQLYRTIRVWLTTLMLSISITMTLVWVVLGLLLGMPNAIIVAVFAGVATFVPNIGAILPLIPITVFTVADDPNRLFIMIPAYLLIQLLESNVITPSLVKAELDIPAGAILIFQLLMTLAFGALGLLLAVPMLAVLVVLVREIYSYDLLKLRRLEVGLETDERGQLVLHEQVGDARPTEAIRSSQRALPSSRTH